jgi:hypothetical protein
MSSFGAYRDPLEITPGVVTVRLGVPSRDGERRRAVTDGQVEGPSGRVCRDDNLVTEGIGMWECMSKTVVKKPLVAVRENEFVVSVRNTLNGGSFARGYRELHRLRWNVWMAPECNHDTSVGVQLSTDVAMAPGFVWDEVKPRVCIAPVRGNQVGRWAAMAGAVNRNVLLAGRRNCLECIVDGLCQDHGQGKWLIVG